MRQMPPFAQPMLAKLSTLPADESQWAFEVKWDGIRAIARCTPARLQLLTRNETIVPCSQSVHLHAPPTSNAFDIDETVWMGQRNQSDGSRGAWRQWCLALLAGMCCVGAVLPASDAESATARASAASLSSQEAAALRRDDRGVYVAFCPGGEEVASTASVRANKNPTASVAEASHAGWPADECLKMDKGPAGLSHTLVGLENVHNWLLGGNGNDTIFAGDAGDVIWGDYHPEGQSESQVDRLHGGAGNDWIYSSHGDNEIWTGGGDDHLLLVYGHGVVFCNGGGLKTFVMRYLPQNRPWKMVGCDHKAIDPYRA
jgi:hypothetical protein